MITADFEERNSLLYEFNQSKSAANATQKVNSIYEEVLDEWKVRTCDKIKKILRYLVNESPGITRKN